MRRNLLLVILAGLFLVWAAPAQAQCPEDPNDHGLCDTLFAEVYASDALVGAEPRQVRVLIRLTNDIPDPAIDSIPAMCIALCFTSSNLAANVVLDPSYNGVHLHPSPELNQSIFRHIPSMESPVENNWMMDLAEEGSGEEWDSRILDLSQGDNFWLAINSGPQDPGFPGGRLVLVATMTFTVEDTTTICLDSCWWPPAHGLLFARSDEVTYIPRTNLPYCFSMSYPGLGDSNADGIVDIGDIVYLIGYLYRGGSPPPTSEVGDANCDGIVDIGDVVRLIGYLFKGEPPPSC
jgi:hypothetical protein